VRKKKGEEMDEKERGGCYQDEGERGKYQEHCSYTLTTLTLS